MIGSRFSICLIVQLLVTTSSVYTTAKPRVEKKSVQWPSGHKCTIIDGLVCGEDPKYFCEWQTGFCTECEDHYCNPLLSTSEECEDKCPAYYQQGYYKESVPNSIVHNNHTNNVNKSSTSTENKDNVRTQHVTSNISSWPIFIKVISVISIAIFFVFSASLGFLLNKHFGLIKKIKTYFDKRCDHLPIPDTNSDDRNSTVELEENINGDHCSVIIDHPTDNNTDSYPNEHNILHPEEREKLSLLVKVDIDAEPISTSTHLLDSSATARCSTESSKAEPCPIQST